MSGTRAQEYSAEHLRRLAGELQELGTTLRRLASVMDDERLDLIRVAGHARLLKAMGDVDRFGADVRDAIRRGCDQQGKLSGEARTVPNKAAEEEAIRERVAVEAT